MRIANTATVIICAISLLLVVPVVAVAFAWLAPISENWAHILRFVLPEVAKNTFILLTLVGVLSGVLGTFLAWSVSAYDFFGARFLSKALILPMAIPAYVLAFIANDFLDYSGAVQTAMRMIGIQYSLPVRSVWTAGVVMALVFYPYVYLLARSAFIGQGVRALEAAQMLGFTRKMAFFRVVLVQCLPWIMGGVMIVLMETLADFGTVSMFNVSTMTTAIYKVWFSLFDLPTAAQLASLLAFVVMMALLVEQRWQKKRAPLPAHAPIAKVRLQGVAHLATATACWTVFLLAFMLPVARLVQWSMRHWQDIDARYIAFAKNTFMLASMGALFVCALALLVAYLLHRYPSALARVALAFASVGYAMPGAVLAVGVLAPVAFLDKITVRMGMPAQWLSSSVIVMVIALATRFFVIAHQPITRQFARIGASQEDAAMLFCAKPSTRFVKIFLPMLRPAFLGAVLLVFVEIAKELPITLMLRRGGWDTLAVRIFEMTNDGDFARAAPPSLLLVLVGLCPVWYLARQSDV